MEKKPIFAFKRSLKEEIQEIERLRSNDPEKCKKLFQYGEALISSCSNGEFSKLRRLLATMGPDDSLMYFSTRAFLAALLKSNLMMADLLIHHGYPVNSDSAPSALHACVSECSDEHSAVVIEYLVRKGADVNRQLPGTWETALHIAVRRQLLESVKSLLLHEADVNAVGQGDIMPLTIAEAIETSSAAEEIAALLKEKGARRTWRRDTTNSDSELRPRNNPIVESTQISCSSSYSVDAPSCSAMHVQTGEQASQKPKSNMIRFAGGGLGPPLMVNTVETETGVNPERELTVADFLVDADLPNTPNDQEDVEEGSVPKKLYEPKEVEPTTPSIVRSSDGGMMFSTG